MRRLRKVWFVFLLVTPVHALNPAKALTQYAHDVWQSEQGLPENSVTAIAQTRDGYLWLGTEEGLVRFDGVRFTIFDKRNTAAMRHNRIGALLADRTGDLWIGTLGGGLLRLHDGKFSVLPIPGGPGARQIFSLLEDRQGGLWIGTESGLYFFQSGKFSVYSVKEGLSANTVWCLAQEPSGVLWIGTQAGLTRMQNGKLSGVLSSKAVRSLLTDKEGSLWIGTEEGLFRWRDEKLTAYSGAGKDGLPKSIVWSIIEDHSGSLWLGATAGVFRYYEGKFSSYTQSNGLSNNQVLSLYEDREGNLWIGTYSGGLNRLRDARFTTYSTADGLSDPTTWTVHEDRQGVMWIGTQTGLNRFENGKFTVITKKDGLADNYVGAVLSDSHNNLWVGTAHGLSRLKAGRWKTYTSKEGLADDYVVALHEDRQGNLWIGTRGGVNRMSGEKLTKLTVKEGLLHKVVRFIQEDRNGSVWIGTSAGLNEFRDGKLRAYTPRDGLADDIVMSVYEDPEGSLWIGTVGGLSRWKDGKFRTYTTKHGLFDDVIFTILEDAQNRLWMSCNNGVFRIDKKQFDDFDAGRILSLTSVAYGKSDGMKSSECNGGFQPAGWKSRDGRLWFPTIQGVVVTDSADRPSAAPPVVIEEIKIDRRPIGSENAEIPPGEGELEFHYTALSFQAPEKTQFRYRLEGFDKEWVYAGRRREAYYTLIPPGAYRFRVAARNQEGPWSETGVFFAFRLRPHIYQTRWFYGFCLVAVALAGTLLYQVRVWRWRARQQELELLVEERTRQLREANEELRRLSSIDDLTGIANHRGFRVFLEQEWRRSLRFGHPVSMLMLDVDYFKTYNDTHGHPSGDACLKQVAGVLSEVINRASDLAARYGGEEFAAILANTPADGAMAVAERIRSAMEALGEVTVSLGVATMVPRQDSGPTDLIAASDAALYAAKQGGRNCVRKAA